MLQQLSLLCLLLPATLAVLTANSGTRHYDDDNTALQLSLEDLEREQQQQQQEQRYDLNRPPLLPTRYEWHPSVAASLPPSYVHDAAQLEQNAQRQRQLQLQQLQQLQQQHQQLSAGYALPPQLTRGFFLLNSNDISATPAAAATSTAATKPATATRLLEPIVPFELNLQQLQQLNGIRYQQQQQAHPLRPPYSAPPPPHHLLLQQSKQYAYAPYAPAIRSYAPNAPRIPLPYPPSFVSFTTRRPQQQSSKQSAFRPSPPDSTPDLFAGRASKSLLESYIPSWEVLRLIQQHQYQQQPQPRPLQRQTLAYAVPSLRLFKRDNRIVKKSLAAQPN